MKPNNLISIIVPVYNREDRIKKCIDALLHQTYKNIEIVCVNDGSTDNSLNILYEYQKKDARVKIVNNEKNMGIAYSRNVGLSSASGEYIMWCDSDDWFEKNMCKKLLRTLKKYDVDLVECSTNDIFEKGLGVRKNLSKESFCVAKNEKWEMTPTAAINVMCVLWNKIFKKSIIDKYHLRFPPISTHEDGCFVLTYCLLSKNVYRITNKLYNYVMHQGSSVNDAYEMNKGIMEFEAIRTLGIWVPKMLQERNLFDLYPAFNDAYLQFLLGMKDMCIRVKNGFDGYLGEKLQAIYTNTPYSSTRMNIFFAVDHNYAEHLCVAMASILVNARNFDQFNFYIIDSGLLPGDKKKIESLKKHKDFNIEYLKVDMDVFKNYPIQNSYLSLATYAKYLIVELKPELDRCLYLDCDIVVNTSLEQLYNMDFDESLAVAVKDSFYPSDFAQKYGIKDYFNAGVLLINARKWRENGITKKLFDATENLGNAGELEHEDQDVLNYVLNEKVKFVSTRWNCQCFSFSFNTAKTKQDMFDIIFGPFIVHYTAQGKPWYPESLHPYAFKYFEYKKLTPYRKNIKKDLKMIYGLKKF